MKKLIYITLFIAFALSCCKDREEPCKETTARFEIYESYCDRRPELCLPNLKYIDADTVIRKVVMLKAMEEGAKYKWEIEATTQDKKQFTLDIMPDYPVIDSTPINIKLTVNKKPERCFPASDSIKTSIRKLVYRSHSKIPGTYYGEGFKDGKSMGKYTIKFLHPKVYPPNIGTEWIKIFNLTNKQDSTVIILNEGTEYGYKYLQARCTGYCSFYYQSGEIPGFGAGFNNDIEGDFIINNVGELQFDITEQRIVSKNPIKQENMHTYSYRGTKLN